MDILDEYIDITHLSNFKTPAKARFYFELHSESQLGEMREIYSFAAENKLPVLLVSGGTNMLFAFDVYDGIVIKNNVSGWEYDKESCLLTSFGSESIWDIAQKLEDIYSQDVWHRFIGLPGSVAGAVYGNAGCFGLETENNFVSCKVLDLSTGEILELNKSQMKFSYRSSILKQEKKYFLISACFDLSKKIEKYHSDVDNIDFRENRQPKGNCCGSFFKNPSKEHSAGYLIEKVGLKGYHIGGAYFSELHANFLMHDGSGSYRDLIDLVELAQKKVFDNFGVKLENEVQIITNQ